MTGAHDRDQRLGEQLDDLDLRFSRPERTDVEVYATVAQRTGDVKRASLAGGA